MSEEKTGEIAESAEKTFFFAFFAVSAVFS